MLNRTSKLLLKTLTMMLNLTFSFGIANWILSLNSNKHLNMDVTAALFMVSTNKNVIAVAWQCRTKINGWISLS